MRDDRLRLEDIREAIEQIEEYSRRGLSEGFRLMHTDEIWSDAISFRNVLVHQYFGLDYEAVWAVVKRDLPVLKTKVRRVLEEHTRADD